IANYQDEKHQQCGTADCDKSSSILRQVDNHPFFFRPRSQILKVDLQLLRAFGKAEVIFVNSLLPCWSVTATASKPGANSSLNHSSTVFGACFRVVFAAGCDLTRWACANAADGQSASSNVSAAQLASLRAEHTLIPCNGFMVFTCGRSRPSRFVADRRRAALVHVGAPGGTR